MPASPIALIGGAYEARSKIANAQRCINLYPEVNQKDAPYPTTHYPTPGLTLFGTPPASGLGRGLYTATNGTLYSVVDASLYRIDSSGAHVLVGTIAGLTTPVSMTDNGGVLVVTDGTATGGWTADLTTNFFQLYPDANFSGSIRVDFVDSRIIFATPGDNSREWYLTDTNTTNIYVLNRADKIGGADPIRSIIATKREVWLLGSLTSEVWYNTGAADFPYGIVPGVFIEHGCAAPFSVAKNDISVYWLSQDRQGQTIVFEGTNYQALRISTHAIEKEFGTYASISDAIGYTYQQDGHTFYVLNFPSADRTWVYDIATKLWHERVSIDSNGDYHRHAGNMHAAAYGKNLVIDYRTGAIYRYDLSNITDNGASRIFLRSFPHLKANDARVTYKYLIADFQCGTVTGTLAGSAPAVALRYSDDGGYSWSDYVTQDLGATGEYNRNVKWTKLGMARDRVFELSWSGDTALNGAILDPEALGS